MEWVWFGVGWVGGTLVTTLLHSWRRRGQDSGYTAMYDDLDRSRPPQSGSSVPRKR